MPQRVETYRPQHQSQATRQHESRASRAEAKRFYASSAWRKLRSLKLKENPLCEDCLKRGETTPAAHVHHTRPRAKFPDLALCYENLESVCQACHNAKGANGGDR